MTRTAPETAASDKHFRAYSMALSACHNDNPIIPQRIHRTTADTAA